MKKSPYGKVVTLTAPATQVECWNFSTGEAIHTLPAGTKLLLEYATENDSTVCMLVDEAGNHPGIMLRHANGKEQQGYRFILKNADLKKLANAKLPKKAFDTVGAIMAYEQGELDEAKTLDLFNHLKQSGILGQLQGHYGREARRLGVA